jgi:seryl-tRNA synthetase
MLSLQRIREDPEAVKEGARRKGEEAPIDDLLAVDAEVRALRTEIEAARHEQKQMSDELRGAPDDSQRRTLNSLKERIRDGESRLAELDARLNELLLLIPNPPDASVPLGRDPKDNVVVRSGGAPLHADFVLRPHYEIGEALGIFDFERAAKISGARFAVIRGDGARLLRALETFMLDTATRDHGYTEVSPPYLVRRDAMLGSGQLPKFEEQAYRTDDDLFLIPTSEVSLVNLYRDEILDGSALPITHTSLTPCWRREAGAAGADTRGYIRLHQFDKVEMVRFTRPEASLQELELLTSQAERVAESLGLHHRVLLLCTGDMGFTQSKTYDVELWAPGMQRWLEASSCSNCGDFQARRANIRYRPAPGERPQFVHTLNGSGLGVPRTFDALLETYQQADGSVSVPEVLRPYMHGKDRIGAAEH